MASSDEPKAQTDGPFVNGDGATPAFPIQKISHLLWLGLRISTALPAGPCPAPAPFSQVLGLRWNCAILDAVVAP